MIFDDLYGEISRIEWYSYDEEWEYFVVKGFERPLIYLAYAKDPVSGQEPDDNYIYVNIKEIKSISIWGSCGRS